MSQPPRGQRPPGTAIDLKEGDSSTGLARDSDASILRTSGSIALATLTSRITGFIRTVLVLAMLGPAISSAFQAAYVLPNMIAEVVLGAVLTAIVIPVLVRAEAEDDDGGAGFINRIFTLTVTVLGAATIIALIAAPLLTLLNVGDGEVNRPLTTALAYLLLPEILFYGLSALFIAILNMKGLFKPGAWAPVLNNIVQIVTLVLYFVMPGEITLNPVRMTNPQLLVLGIGTTLGVVLQAGVLLPYLKRAGVRLQWRFGIDDRLRRFGTMALAIVIYVAILQVGLVITYRIASSATDSGISVYATHWQLLQLPYGVLGVTILTAIMPRLSRNAAADDTQSVVDDLSLATRLTMVALVPTVAYMTFFGPALGVAIFNFGKFGEQDAGQLGSVLAWGAFTLIPYAMTLVQLRVFYAREDAWTPTLMVLGITVIKVVSSYLGPVLFDDPDLVVRWLALSNGLGYLVGAVVGHYLLRNKLHNAHLVDVKRTTIVSIAVSVGVALAVWAIATWSGLDGLVGEFGKVGSIVYLGLTAAVVLGVTYALLAAAKVPDVVAIGNAVRRVLGRFIPALAPPPSPQSESSPTITVQFPRITADESLPYSGQVQLVRRFDRGTATWQSYSVHSGGVTGNRDAPRLQPAPPPAGAPRDIRYRRKGVRHVSDSDVGTTAPRDAEQPASAPEPENTSAATQAGRPTEQVNASRPRGPRLVPGAAVAGGRYRLLDHHGGTRGLQFWRALDVNLDRQVALTFVDAEQLAPPLEHGAEVKATDHGPQAVLSRTLQLGQLSSAGVARVLDVVRGSSGGIVVTEWVNGSSLADVARAEPSAIGAARAVRSLAAAAEMAHRAGGALSIDHPDRIRISNDGNAVLAFPGTLAGDDRASDVRGLGAVLYALLLERWPLDAETGHQLVTTAATRTPVGGLAIADPGRDGAPVEPREVDAEIPFEISAVAARALDGSKGIRTAATVQHVLDQATVLDLQTDMLPAITDVDGPAPVRATPTKTRTATSGAGTTGDADDETPRRRNIGLLVGIAMLVLFLIIAVIVWASGMFKSEDPATDLNSLLTTTSAPPAAGATPAPAPVTGADITLTAVRLVDFSGQSGDSSATVRNVLAGTGSPWQSDSYFGPNFAGLKKGLGLSFDLGDPQSVTSVTVRTPSPGFKVSVRTSPTAQPTNLDQTTEIGSGRIDQQSTTLRISGSPQAQHILLWITEPPAVGGGYRVAINQVSMTN
ncbi:murein biosynthesis integral membrane protein MurJ [Gordonia sp. ABSL1-1]|uniref:murein biosynthesis integral membrane protein MurJ n=1 Tax=Gordonia sp. ABSL1-1 TaxID=3053923 RepID=UPI002573C749|nr:murein biosynthesis integral membrane protein MurJ [Gordonia sp. ABSL1-1]MDL9936600.1 murein biosynthesis integral membrane protein MurJ [Gordonia sp. ABSL1-1]